MFDADKYESLPIREKGKRKKKARKNEIPILKVASRDSVVVINQEFDAIVPSDGLQVVLIEENKKVASGTLKVHNSDIRFKLRGQEYDEATFVMLFIDLIEPNFKDYTINGEKLELGKPYAVKKDRLVDAKQFSSATQRQERHLDTDNLLRAFSHSNTRSHANIELTSSRESSTSQARSPADNQGMINISHYNDLLVENTNLKRKYQQLMKEKQQMELQEKRQRNMENRIYQMQMSISNLYKQSKKLFDSGNSVNDQK